MYLCTTGEYFMPTGMSFFNDLLSLKMHVQCTTKHGSSYSEIFVYSRPRSTVSKYDPEWVQYFINSSVS